MKQILKFAIEDIKLIQELSDSQLAIAEVKVCHNNMNLHEKPISLDSMKLAELTLINKFLVGGYDGWDFKGHEGKAQLIIGFFPKENNFRYIEENGKTYFVANAIISKLYSEWAFDIFKKENLKECSMEITVLETEQRDDGYEWITSYIYNAVTVLGNNNHAACPGSDVQIIKFSSDEIEKYEKIYHEYSQFKIPSIVKQNAEKGIFLKQNNPKGATAVNVSIANQLINNEFVSLDLLHNIIKFSAKTKTETAQYLLGGFESLEWAENIINPQTEKFEEVKKEEEIVPTEEIEKLEVIENEQQEEMGADANVEAVAQAELADKQAETDKVLAEESKEQMAEEVALEEKMTEEAMAEEVTPKENEDNFQAKYTDMSEKYEEMYNKYSALEVQMSEMTAKMSTSEDQMAIYMSENEQLKKFKSDIEEKEMLSVIEYTLTEVMESMPKEQMEELREDAKNFCASDLNIWVNKVKAEAFSFSKGKTNNDGIMKVGLPFVNENNKTESKSLWDKI